MSMPKAAVNEHYSHVTRENQVRPSRQLTAAKLETQPQAMQIRANSEFGLCIFALNTRHHAATYRRIDNVRHTFV